MILNVAYQEGAGQIYTKAVFQHSSDVMLLIQNMPIVLPAKISISNSKDFGNAVDYAVNSLPFTIPGEYFISGDYVYIWFETSEHQLLVVVPVMRKPTPTKAPDGGTGQAYEYDEEEESINIIPANGLTPVGIKNESEETENV